MNVLYKIKSVIISWFADIRIYIGGFILFGSSAYEIKGDHMREILDTLEPGDILLRRYSHYIGSRLVPGYWSHVALYVGDGEVIHMLGNGIAKEDILTFMRCDDIAILRGEEKDRAYNAIIGANNYYNLSIKYDYSFNFKDKSKMSCTELLYDIYAEPEITKRISDKYICPDDFLNSIFKVIWTKGEK
jgi:hypothetical protein